MICGWLLNRFSVQNKPSLWVLMGAVAFVLLMVAELWVSVFAFGRSVAEHFAIYHSLNAILGLAGPARLPVISLAASAKGRAGRPR